MANQSLSPTYGTVVDSDEENRFLSSRFTTAKMDHHRVSTGSGVQSISVVKPGQARLPALRAHKFASLDHDRDHARPPSEIIVLSGGEFGDVQ